MSGRNGGQGRGRGGPVGRHNGSGSGPSVEGVTQGMRGLDAGSGRGRGRGGDHGPKRERPINIDDIVPTKPSNFSTKVGKPGKNEQQVSLVANFFKLDKSPDFGVTQYAVHFVCEGDLSSQTRKKKYLLNQMRDELPAQTLFCGDQLFTTTKLKKDEINKTVHYDSLDGRKVPVEIKIKLVKNVLPTDPGFLQVLNQINGEMLKSLGFNAAGSAHFDMSQKQSFPKYHLEIWQGIDSTIRQHEHQLLMKADIASKVIRMDTAYDTLRELRGDQVKCKQVLLGATVVTHYNNDKTYRVDDVDFNSNPEDYVFDHHKYGTISLLDYFKRQYNADISDRKQPLLVSMPKARDRRNGMRQVMLIPELCRMTGLTDRLRADFRAMQEMASVLKQEPAAKLSTTERYAKKIVEGDKRTRVLHNWGIQLDPRPVNIKARVLPPQGITLGTTSGGVRNVGYDQPNKAEWSNAIKDGMLTPCILRNWVVVYPTKIRNDLMDFLGAIRKISPTLRLNIESAPRFIEMPDDRLSTYNAKVKEACIQGTTFVVVALFKQATDIYKCVKSELLVRQGLPNQVITSLKCMKKDKQGKVKLAIATKVAAQIACKLGAVPWKVAVPLQNTMVIGFDTFHNKRGGKKSVGALTASYDANWCKYYSTVSRHEDFEEITNQMEFMFTEALRHYQKVNKSFPVRIFFYRDGVGEGQIQNVKINEVEKLRKVLAGLGLDAPPKLTFTVVSKRIAPRFFLQGRGGTVNPVPGTVVDDVVTLPERYDYFLVAQNVNQGTVNPTSYNIIHDDNVLGPEKNQLLSFKLCHLYQNWAGTVRVPAPCQLAHKLAYLIGENDLDDPHTNLKPTHYCL